MRKILFPTDFSESAEQAFEYAANHILDQECEVHFCHVYQMPAANVSGTFYLMEEIKNQAEKDLKSYITQVKNKYPDWSDKIKSHILQGDFQEQCNSLAIQIGASCLIMATKGASGIKETLIGSNTSSLIKRLKITLMVIPDQYSESIDRLIFAYDGLGLNDETKRKLIDFQDWKNYPIEGIHIETEEDKNWSWTDFEQVFPNAKHHSLQAENIDQGLTEISKDHNQLLCVIRHQQSFWEKLFGNSDSQKLIMHAKGPVLVISD